ncbi:MAG: pyridoxamine 5'-phosphate oxidase family protein [Gammaproteobacteria bacterium]|nr:pyridoxamine 5'-phosphate oxidase family protein [Gammaproteobacteria bacterium]
MSRASKRTKVRRNAGRGNYEGSVIADILDANQICHVSYVENGEPRIIPTLYMRKDNYVYLHGNRQAALLKHLGAGGLACFSVMSVQGVVVARSGFHCSMNYRSVVLFGRGECVPEDERVTILDGFVAALVPGHEAQVRAHTEQEINATTAVRIPIDEASAKLRDGPPIDDESDFDSDVWAGVIPLKTQVLAPIPSPNLKAGIPVPDYISSYGKTR